MCRDGWAHTVSVGSYAPQPDRAMTLPPNITRLSSGELATLLIQHVFETNLVIRALVLQGVPVNADLVDRSDPVYPGGSYPEFQVQT